MKLVTVAEMQAIEKEAHSLGITYDLMMENAGRGLADVILNEFAADKDSGILGLVGSGNNGGDTLVALAHLAEKGWKATACIVRPRPPDDPLVTRLIRLGGMVFQIADDANLAQLKELLNQNAILLDGILGTGFRLPLKSDLARYMEFINSTITSKVVPPIVLAVDCPSGIDCDSGDAAPECIPANITITMAAYKRGLLMFPANLFVGDICLVGIGLPEGGETLNSWSSLKTFVVNADYVRNNLPRRPPDAHKGTFGTALIVAGSLSYTGAALLAGQSAYRIGAGLVTLAIPSPLHSALAGQIPEATWIPLPHEDGYFSPSGIDSLLGNLHLATAVLIGPGFGIRDCTARFIQDFIASIYQNNKLSLNLVFDADGLKLLSKVPEWNLRLRNPAVLTPHPGEMSILTEITKEDIQSNRIEIALRFSREWGHVVVLKGAFTVVASPDGDLALIPVATPALARAGTGDVLAGAIVGLLAQGLKPFPAAVCGAWLHAQAGLAASKVIGNTASVLAGDILSAIPRVLSDVA